MKIEEIQAALREHHFDGWLFYDHHHRDPIAYRILGLDESLLVTRRWYYLIPAEGEPRKLVHRIEESRLDSLAGEKRVYSSWQELESELRTMLAPFERLAMQYSPRNAIMSISLVDAGTVELLREFGKTIMSSADLVSRFEAVLTPEQIAQSLPGTGTDRRDSCRGMEGDRPQGARSRSNPEQLWRIQLRYSGGSERI